MRFWQACVGLLVIVSCARAQSPCRSFLVQPSFRETTLNGYLFAAHTTDTTLNQVRRATFRPVVEEILHTGNDPRQHWIRCCLKNTGNRPEALIFGVDFAHIDDMSVYVLDESGHKVLQRWEHVSRHTPLARRPVASRVFAFPIHIQPGQSITLYGRFVRKQSVLMLPIKLMTRERFFANGFSFDIALYMGLGILLIASSVSLVLYTISKERALLFYSFYVIAYSIATLSLEGLREQYMPIFSRLDENTHLVMFALADFTLIQFAVAFMRLNQELTRLWLTWVRIVTGGSLLLMIYLLIVPFSYINSGLLSGLTVATLLLVIGLIGKGLKLKREGTRLLLISFSPALLIGLWFAFSILFRLPRNWYFYQLAYLTPFWQLMILGVGLGIRLIQDQRQALLAVGQLQREQAEAIIQAQEMERQRIAADLHDDLGGTLATIYRQFLDMRRQMTLPKEKQVFEQLEPLLKKSTLDLRRIAHNLMPPEFAWLGLRPTIEQLVKNQPEQKPHFSFVMVGVEHRLTLTTELNAYRIVSELIQNIHKHAQADRAAVQLLYYADHLVISVDDDGLGDQLQKSANSRVGIGLKNCNLRAAYIGAKLWYTMSEAGTLVILEIPYAGHLDATTQTVSSVAG